MNVILVISDTFRRDHLPCYGNQHMHTPHLDSFASQAQVFQNFYAASFPTVPARADILTGRYTFPYMNWGPLPQNELTLPEVLHQNGIQSFGIADTPFVARNGYGHDRGFSDFVYVRGQKEGPERNDYLLTRKSEEDYLAPRTLKGAADWLERHYQEQFFMYVDTWDPHEPWDAPDYYVKKYLPEYEGKCANPCYWDYRQDGFTPKDIEISHAAYCGEISMVDTWFGFLFDRVKSLNLLENTAIIFTSDHGFYFGEHDLFGKRRFRWPGNIPFIEGFERGLTLNNGFTYRSPLHNEIVQRPCLMYIPGMQPGNVNGLSCLPDLMPTILDLFSASRPETVQAQSLLPLIHGQTDKVHDIIVTGAPLLEEKGALSKTVDDLTREVMEVSPCSITDGEWDLLFAISGEPVELYRTREDPGHIHNVVQQYPAESIRLHKAFIQWLLEVGAPPQTITPRLTYTTDQA